MKKKSYFLIILIIVASFAVGIFFYPQMPEKVASHWNIHGEVDGYISKFWGLFLMPIISLGMLILFLIIPKIDPLKKNIEKFKKYFDNFILFIILFLFYLYLLTILWNLEYKFDITRALMPAFGILFFYVGVMTEHAKRNWFIGIRTPWTLSSDKVWEKTHKLGGKLFKASGMIIFLGLLFPQFALWFVSIPLTITVIFTILYSYLEFRKK